MNKKLATGLTVMAAIIAIATPIAFTIYEARRQGVEAEKERTATLARSVVQRSDMIAAEMYAGIERLVRSAPAAEPCSDAHIRAMQQIDLGSRFIQAVGYVSRDRVICSSYGRHPGEGTALGPVDFVVKSTGAKVRNHVEFPLAKGERYIVIERDNYAAVVHSGSPIDVLEHDKELVLASFTPGGKQIRASRGTVKPEWLASLPVPGNSITLVDGSHVVTVARSERFESGAIAAVPIRYADEHAWALAKVLVPIGIVGGAILAFAVLYLARLQMALPAVMRAALRRNEFFLVYQPIVELSGGRCVGAEALIRWRRQGGEMVRPDLFIPVAEETGLIHEITKRVFQIVAREAAALLKAHPHLHIGINLSSRDLEMDDTGHMVHELIRTMGVQPHNILVEATERGFMQADVARRIMDDIHALNVRIAIDDFGTGYSSLSYLEKFKLDYLKIDKSFVDSCGADAATSQVVPHIIEMAKSLKLEMIAEGVESEAQLKFLQQRGVQYAQGWLFAKPMSFAQFASYVAKSEKLAA